MLTVFLDRFLKGMAMNHPETCDEQATRVGLADTRAWIARILAKHSAPYSQAIRDALSIARGREARLVETTAFHAARREGSAAELAYVRAMISRIESGEPTPFCAEFDLEPMRASAARLERRLATEEK